MLSSASPSRTTGNAQFGPRSARALSTPASYPRRVTIDPKELGELREHWRGFAREDPLAYARVGSDPENSADFYVAGAQDVADILAFAGRDVGRDRALDFGCGPGRHLGALAMEFKAVDGVDIAAEMLAAARASGLPANVELTQSSGVELTFPDATFDFVMSVLVFQHIPDDQILIANVREIRRVTKAAGRAVLQFDSRSTNLGVRMIQALPDALLPRLRRRYMRRYRRSPGAVSATLAEAGWHVVRESGRGSAAHFVAVNRSDSPSP